MSAHVKTQNIGVECLQNVISEQQPAYCHEWTRSSGSDKHEFSAALQEANNALFKAGLDPVHGITKKKENHIVDNLPTELERLRAYTTVHGKTMAVEEFKAQLHEFIQCVNQRAPKIRTMLGSDKDWNPENAMAVGLALAEKNMGMWGSRRQYAFGQTISKLLSIYNVTKIELHPVFAVMLSPASGMAGWGNWVLYVGDLHDSVNVHAVVHDAFGYVLSYHGKGPGYNYLQTWSIFRTSSPLCCQPQGYWRAYQIMKTYGALGQRGRLARARFVMKEMKHITIPGPDKDTVKGAEALLARK